MGCGATKNTVEILQTFSEDGHGNKVYGKRINKITKAARLEQKTTTTKALNNMKENPKGIGNGENFGFVEEFDTEEQCGVKDCQDGSDTKNIDGINKTEQKKDIDESLSGRREKDHHSRMGRSSDVAQEGAMEGLHQKEFKGDIELKDCDEVSTDPNSSGSFLMVLCKTEDLDVEIKTDNCKEETVQNKQFESDS